MEKMQISSSNSEHNSESDYSQKGDDSDFEKAFYEVFRYEPNKEYPFKIQKIYKEDKIKNDVLKNERGTKTNETNVIVEIKETPVVQIKSQRNKCPEQENEKEKVFIVNKIEDHIAFIPAKFREYYEKYKDDFIFKVMKEKILRKEKPDDIRKKIKSRFFKSLKNCINKELDKKGIELKFEYLPQNFISNISKEEIKLMLDKTLKEIINIYCIERNDEKSEKNLNLLKYLEVQKEKNNDKINKIYKIFQTKIKDLFNEYIHSEEFEQSLVKLKEEGNYFDYIKSYINEANNFINFFSN
jgi:hypothetical protein